MAISDDLALQAQEPSTFVKPIPVRPADDPFRSLVSVDRKANLFTKTMLNMETVAFNPELHKVFDRRWSIKLAGEMVGRSPQSIRDKEASGDFPTPEKDKNNRRVGYSLQDINRMRDYFKTRPARLPEEEPAVIAFSQFKGGSGKSVLSVHLAQYLAIKGYRVLMIDCDPQGSASTMFGINPDLPKHLRTESEAPDGNAEVLEYSLEEYLARVIPDFDSCIKPSYMPGIDIVPANLKLFNVEYRMAADIKDDPGILNDLRDGIRSVWHKYDVVILDPPPALGLLSLSVINAANALVIPMRPSVVDFASTRTFLTMLLTNLRTMIESGFPIYYHFEMILLNGMDDTKSAHVDITDDMRTLFSSDDLFTAIMKDSAEIDNASKEMMTVYDLQSAMTSHQTHKRCVNYLDSVNSDIETRIRRIWPSHRDALRQEGRL